MAKLVDAAAGRVECGQQGDCVSAHRDSTRSGCRSCGLRKAALISAAVWSTRRLRPARRSAAAIRLTDSLAAAAGVGAMPSAPATPVRNQTADLITTRASIRWVEGCSDLSRSDPAKLFDSTSGGGHRRPVVRRHGKTNDCQAFISGLGCSLPRESSYRKTLAGRQAFFQDAADAAALASAGLGSKIDLNGCSG